MVAAQPAPADQFPVEIVKAPEAAVCRVVSPFCPSRPSPAPCTFLFLSLARTIPLPVIDDIVCGTLGRVSGPRAGSGSPRHGRSIFIERSIAVEAFRMLFTVHPTSVRFLVFIELRVTNGLDMLSHRRRSL